MMSDTGNMITDAAERILSDLADPQTVTASRDDKWKEPLWSALEENGLSLASVPEDLGGAGLAIPEVFEIIAAAGRFALAVPLVETLLAGWLLAKVGIRPPQARMSVAPARPDEILAITRDGLISGRAAAVPFAGEVDDLAVIAAGPEGAVVALVSAADCTIKGGVNLAGDAQGDVIFDAVKPVAFVTAPTGIYMQRLMLMGCVARSQQISGALHSLLERSVAYAGERIAFGRPIGKFQAVQQNLARLAGEVAASAAAAASAIDAIGNAQAWDDGVLLEIAAAKIRCAEAAETGSAIAHQIHGAIGITSEHVLHRFTLRALAWRDDFGSESYWAVHLGKLVAERGADELWPLIASR